MGPDRALSHCLSDTLPPELGDKVRRIGADLIDSIRHVVKEIPHGPHSPTSLGKRLGMSRVILSRVLNAIASTEPYEALHRIPGPESLRVMAERALRAGVSVDRVRAVETHIERFAALIRDDFGSRSELTAAISSTRPDLKEHFELVSRQLVFKGLRDIRGVCAETWVNTVFVNTSTIDPDYCAFTDLQGAIGLQCLRPDANVRFMTSTIDRDGSSNSAAAIDLSRFYVNQPATFETKQAGIHVVNRLVNSSLGKNGLVDMLAVSQTPKSTPRFATAARPEGGIGLFPDIPARRLVFDVLVRKGTLGDALPGLHVYNIGVRGPVIPHDPIREIDRMAVPERIESLDDLSTAFLLPEIPNYESIVRHVCTTLGFPLHEYRLHRLRMAYPVQGFQFAMTFKLPAKPQ